MFDRRDHMRRDPILPERLKMLKAKTHRVRARFTGMEYWKATGIKEVQAQTEKEAAAGKACGGLLFKQGPRERVRAMVLSSSANDNPTLFYER